MVKDKENPKKKQEVGEYELEITEAQTKIAKRKLADIQIAKLTDELYIAKMSVAIFKKTKKVVETREECQVEFHMLPISEKQAILDDVYGGKPGDIIQPSHILCKYSLISGAPEIIKHVLRQDISVLEQVLGSAAVRASEITREYSSENTMLAHEGDIVYWTAWLILIGFKFNTPITENEIVVFIVQHAEGLDNKVDKKLVDQHYKSQLGTHKLSTIKRRVASLSVYLDIKKWPNPCRNKEIKYLLQKLTKKYGTSKPTGKAITKDILNDMLDTCGDKFIDIRDKAVLLFTWGTGGRRRSEVVAADMKDLNGTPEGDYVYTIPKSKTDQEGKGSPVPVKGKVAQALRDWLSVSKITEGRIFRSVRKGGNVGEKLSPVDIHRIVRRRLKKAGYDETQYGAHSLRSGFVTEAGRKNKPLGDVMALTTHKSVKTVMGYYQAGSIINNSAANLAD